MKVNAIGCLDTFVLRTPLFPIHFYTDLLNDYSTNRLFEVLENNLIKEAVKIASPELISELEKLLSNPKEIQPE